MSATEPNMMTCRDYFEIAADAQKARVAPYGHACGRYDHVMTEWRNQGDKEARFEVWATNFIRKGETHEDEVLLFCSEKKSECEAYMRTCTDKCELRENGVCEVCNMYEKRKLAVSQGKQPSFLIVAYGVSRHFLHPAEGGCWGNDTEVLEVRKAYTFEQGLRHARELRDNYPQPKYGIYSCANRGEPEIHIRCVYAENDPRMPQDYRAPRTYE